jgi:hypothetical protein
VGDRGGSSPPSRTNHFSPLSWELDLDDEDGSNGAGTDEACLENRGAS